MVVWATHFSNHPLANATEYKKAKAEKRFSIHHVLTRFLKRCFYSNSQAIKMI